LSSKIYSTDKWIPVPMISREGLSQGFAGGEGCRRVFCPTLDSNEGKYGLFGTDIGGLYRSVDGGKSWQIATLGLDCAGATGCAFDPHNPARCMVVGANSAAQEVNGLFLSTDYGASWRPVLRAHTCNSSDFRHQIAYDANSYDRKIGGCAVIYWSREDNDTCRYAKNDPALYRSVDGGENWQRLPDSAEFGGCSLAVHAKNGWVFAAKADGIYRSKNKGENFEKILSAEVLSLSYVATLPDNIYATTTDGLYISEDCGDSFYMLRGKDYPTFCPTRLAVSPADPMRMILQDDRSADADDRFGHTVWYTHDGGKSWAKSVRHTETKNVAWCANNAALSGFCWHPTDKDSLICNWGYICLSQNGGKDFWYSATGFSGVSASGYTRFNINNPDLVSMTSQNFNGAVSTDGGKSWDYICWSGYDWGGTVYSSYLMSKNVAFAAVRDVKHRHNRIFTSFDGGKTVNDTGLVVQGTTVAMGAPNKTEIGFIGEWRTDDMAQSWHKMAGCNGVFCADKDNNRLFGIDDEQYVVISCDSGINWSRITNAPYNVTDLAYSTYNNRLYAVCGGALIYLTVGAEGEFKIAKQFEYNHDVKNVAVDLGNPRIIYVTCKSDVVYRIKNIWRSEDGGESFVCLSREIGDGRDDCLDGARRPAAADVNGKTGELFVFTSGKGVWKIAPPADC